MTTDRSGEVQIDASVESSFLDEWTTVGPPDLQVFFQNHAIVNPLMKAQIIQLDQRERAVRGISIIAEEYFAVHSDVAGDSGATFEVVFQEFALSDDRDPTLHRRLVERFPQFAVLLHRQIAVYRLLTVGQTQRDVAIPYPTIFETALGDVPPSLERRFEFQELIGRGGSGIVFRAVDRALGRTVAIKVLHKGGVASLSQTARFLAEAEIIAKLQHPSIVQLFEVIRDDDALALLLEYVSGGTLADRLLTGPLEPKEAAVLLATLARAVDYAHKKGIIHRDIKPGNVLLDFNPSHPSAQGRTNRWNYCPKLADFGLAKSLVDTSTSSSPRNTTQTGEIVGTPRYLSPEQINGNVTTIPPAADVHALGILLYECLCGQTPFLGPTVVDYLRQIADEQPRFTQSNQKRLPTDLQVICLKCLEKESHKRYASAGDLADDLDRYLTDLPILARPISKIETLTRWVRRRPAVAGLLTALALLLVLIAGGSTTAAIWLNQETTLAQQAERKATTLEQQRRAEFHQSLIENARSQSVSGEMGQRFETIERLQEAMKIVPYESLTQEKRADIASIFLSGLSHADLKPIASFPCFEDSTLLWEAADATLTRVIHGDKVTGSPLVQRLDGSEDPWFLTVPGEHFESFRLFKFSDSGRWIAEAGYTGANHVLRIWDVTSRTVIWHTEDGAHGEAFAFHPDDQHFVYEARGSIREIDLLTSRVKRQSPVQFSAAGLLFSPNGKMLAVYNPSRVIQILDAASWKPSSVNCPVPVSDSMAWNPDNKEIVIGTLDRQLYAWNVLEQRGRLLPFSENAARRIQISLYPNSYLAVGDRQHSVLIRNDGNQRVVQVPGRLVGLSSSGTKIAYARQGQLVVADIVDPLDKQQFHIGTEWCALNQDGSLLAFSGEGGGGIYRTDRATIAVNLGLDAPGPLAFSNNGDALGTFGVFSGPLVWPIQLVEGRLNVGPPKSLPIHVRSDGVPIGLQPQHRGKGLTFSPDGRWMAIADSRKNRLMLSPISGGEPRVLGLFNGPTEVRFDPKGRYIAAAGILTRRVVVWDIMTSSVSLELDRHVSGDFSSDGRLFASRSDQAIHVFDASTWKRLREIPAGYRPLVPHRPIAFQPGSNLIAVVGGENAIALYDSRNGHQIARLVFDDPEFEVTSLSFSGDGGHLAAVRIGRDVHLWNLSKLNHGLSVFGFVERLAPPPKVPDGGSLPALAVDRGSLTPARQWYVNWRSLAAYEAIQQRWLDSLEATDKAIKWCPPELRAEHAALRTSKGDYLWRLGRSSEATAEWHRATEILPDFALPRERLAFVYVAGPVQLRDPASVAALIAPSLLEENTKAISRSLIGMAFIRLHRDEEGRRLLEAVQDQPDWQPLAQYFLAISYAQSQQVDLAKKVLTSLAASPTTPSPNMDPLGIIDLSGLSQEVKNLVDSNETN